MNSRRMAVLVALGLAGNLFAGENDQAEMVKQRAKALANQNNAQQGLPPQYPSASAPATPATPATPAPPTLTPAQQAFLLLNFNLAAIKGDPKPEQIQTLADALQANAHGAVKPSAAELKKLAGDLAAALANHTVSAPQRGRIQRDIVAIFNDTTMPLSQYNDVVADVPSVLKKVGTADKLAAAVGDDLKAIAAEIRKK